ncbi:MAG: outer membrane protein transport protein, partial [Calditrichia bacterium]|nr:outer membrane protein transport protein [Calditrichia bacterium]
MKKTLLYLFVVLSGIQFVYSQDNTKVHEFQGGNINFDLTYYTGFIYGIGSRNLNTNSSLENYGAESIYWNPAGLAFMEKSQLFVDYAPPLNVNPKAFVDFQDEINTSVDDEFKSDLTDNAIYTYPDLNTNFPSGSRIQSIALAMPFNKFTFGLSYYNPFELKLEFLESGFRTFMVDNEESPTEQQTAFRASGDVNGYLHLNAETYAFAMAYKFTEEFAAGLTIEYYNVLAKAKANLNFYGSIAIGYNGNFGETLLFNDPNAGYPNSLFSTLEGKFSGNSWGMRLGSSYRIQDFGEIAFTANIPFTVHLDGNLDIIQNQPAFYVDGEIDEDKIDENETRRTEQTIYHSNGMRIKLPGNVNLGYTHAFGGFTLITNIGYHFNEFSYDYSNTESYSDDSTVVS